MDELSADEHLKQRLEAIPNSPQLRFLPVRHHSPACAQHVQTVIQNDQPDIVLIEGPVNASELLPYLCLQDAKPPLALYLFHQDERFSALNALAGEQTRHRAFYPLAEFSPEWVAIRSAHKIGAEIRFIDLPYGSHSEAEFDSEAGQDFSLLHDANMTCADPTERLVQLSGCRDFNEWWDRYFESGGLAMTADDFFIHLLSWCLLIRDSSTALSPETLAREQFMAAHVHQAVNEGKSVCVITGGFHTEAIAQQYVSASTLPVVKAPAGESGQFLLPYTLGRLDAANGYSAGMTDTSYYQTVWEQQSKGKQQAHSAAAEVIVQRVARSLQAQGQLVSLPDSIETLLMSHRLGALRGVKPGRTELLDAMVACFVKDSLSDHNRIDFSRMLQNDRLGQLPRHYPAPPLVVDFRRQCEQFQLPITPFGEVEKTLDIYRSERHRLLSRFLHRLHFLDIPYAERRAGPDFAQGQDLARVREIWHIKWSPEAEAMLTERMAYGADIQEAALHYLLEQLKQEWKQAPQLIVAALQMGLHQALTPAIQQAQQWLQQESQLPHLVDGLKLLAFAEANQQVLGSQALKHRALPSLHKLLSDTFDRACGRLTWLGQSDASQRQQYLDALADLNALATEPLHSTQQHWANVPYFLRSIQGLYQSAQDPALVGRAAAILSSRQMWSLEQTEQALNDALANAYHKSEYLGGFLLGYLPLAKAQLSQSPLLLSHIDHLISQWPEDIFLTALPDLRLAFTSLKPAETQTLSLALGAQIEQQVPDQKKKQWSNEQETELLELLQSAAEHLQHWGIKL